MRHLALFKWCSDERIQFTRSRPYHKNDNCFVEQKNNSCVRYFVGYDRLGSAAEMEALAAIYTPLCPLLNFFIPTQKLISKKRLGSKVVKVYHKENFSPYQRLAACEDLPDEVKAKLGEMYKTYNPVLLQTEVNKAVLALDSLKRSQEFERRKPLPVPSLHAV